MSFCRCGHSMRWHAWREIFNGREMLDNCASPKCGCALFVEETFWQRVWRNIWHRRTEAA